MLKDITSFIDPKEKYAIQLCSPINNAQICHDGNGIPVVTYVCETDTSKAPNQSVSGGNEISFGSNSNGDLMVTYSTGSSEGCATGETRTTEVVVECDPRTELVSSTSLQFTDGACRRRFLVKALVGCRMCDNNFALGVNKESLNKDYNVTIGECNDVGENSVTFFRTSACNGPEIYTKTTECVRSFTVPFAIVAGLCALAVLFFIGLIFLFVRNRRIRNQYDVLLEQTTDREGNPMFELSQDSGGTSMLESTDQEDVQAGATL